MTFPLDTFKISLYRLQQRGFKPLQTQSGLRTDSGILNKTDFQKCGLLRSRTIVRRTALALCNGLNLLSGPFCFQTQKGLATETQSRGDGPVKINPFAPQVEVLP